MLVLLEFQSRVDRHVALRAMTYTGLALEGLVRRGERSNEDLRSTVPRSPLPPVIPFVVYNGKRRWTAPLDVSELFATAPPVLADLDDRSRRELDRMVAEGKVEAMGSLAVERWREQKAQIHARGRTEGIEHYRHSLARQASRRFGAGPGERLSVLLSGVSEPERLAAVGDAIIDCGTDAELLAAVRRIVGVVNSAG